MAVRTRAFNAIVGRLRPILVRGLSEMRGGISYPDANRTLRFTYGDVKGYIDGILISGSGNITSTGNVTGSNDTGLFIVNNGNVNLTGNVSGFFGITVGLDGIITSNGSVWLCPPVQRHEPSWNPNSDST